jgi:hypothetical protein
MPTIRLELTGEQKAQIRAATGRDVTRLELRLQALTEPTEGQDGTAEPETAAGPDQEPAPGPSSRHPASRPRRSARGADPHCDQEEHP